MFFRWRKKDDLNIQMPNLLISLFSLGHSDVPTYKYQKITKGEQIQINTEEGADFIIKIK